MIVVSISSVLFRHFQIDRAPTPVSLMLKRPFRQSTEYVLHGEKSGAHSRSSPLLVMLQTWHQLGSKDLSIFKFGPILACGKLNWGQIRHLLPSLEPNGAAKCQPIFQIWNYCKDLRFIAAVSRIGYDTV